MQLKIDTFESGEHVMVLRSIGFPKNDSLLLSGVLLLSARPAFASTTGPALFTSAGTIAWMSIALSGLLGFLVFLYMHKRLLRGDKWVGLAVAVILAPLLILSAEAFLSPDEARCLGWAGGGAIESESSGGGVDSQTASDWNINCNYARTEFTNSISFPFEPATNYDANGAPVVVSPWELRTYRVVFSICWAIVIFFVIKAGYIAWRKLKH